MQEMRHKFESEEEADWAIKQMQADGGSKPRPHTNPQPNRKARRAFQSKMKKRVKKIIKGQDKRNAKYRAAIKARSTGDDRTPGVGEVDPGQDFL